MTRRPPISEIRSAARQLRELLAPGSRVVEGGYALDEMAVVAATMRRRRGPSHVLIDVGAHVGTTAAHFVDIGWAVHGFEPDDDNRAGFLARFGQREDVHLDPRAVSDVEADEATFFRSSVSSGISALSPFHPEHVAAGRVGVTTLSSYLRERNIEEVTVLKTDVEGHDLHVLRGFPWDLHRPAVVVCEFDDAKTKQLGYDYDDMARFLLDRGYRILVSEWYPVVEYGRMHRHRRVHRYPTALRSERAWGNLIATPSLALAARLRVRFALARAAASVATFVHRHWDRRHVKER